MIKLILVYVSQVATIVAAVVTTILMFRAFYYGWLGKRLASADDLVLSGQWELSIPSMLVTEEVFQDRPLERNADLTKPISLSIRNNGKVAVVGLRIRVSVQPDVHVNASPYFDMTPEWEPGTNTNNAYIFTAKPGINLPRLSAKIKKGDVITRRVTKTQIGKFTVSNQERLRIQRDLSVYVDVMAENLDSPAEFQLFLEPSK